MELWEQIKSAYPEIQDSDFIDKIILQDDLDGTGAFIAKWDYEKPLPQGMIIGKLKK